MGKRKLFVEYDENARKDYLTGFHKRKQARRKKAAHDIAEQARLTAKLDRAEVGQ